MNKINSGFTLIELMVVITLIGILIPPMTQYLMAQKRTYFSWEKKLNNLQVKMMALDCMAREIQNSRVLSTSTSQQLDLLNGTDVVSYQLSREELCRVKNATVMPLADGVKALRFLYPQPKMVYANLDGYLIRVRLRNQ